ncbi:M20/M25/M40 family metallo-hydrolase [Kitasatospora sp. NPDC015120]|uniref:M20/M25/M40 family metallo-hydrolase n=1 Tax=Kitasatospora sp. NPDC015120 TaxID=3364023 RepID=UPI0036F45780
MAGRGERARSHGRRRRAASPCAWASGGRPCGPRPQGAGGVPREPEITRINSFPLTVNEPGATGVVQASLTTAFGDGRVFTLPQPLTGSEDFGIFGAALGVPSVFWHFGGADPALYRDVDPASLLEDGLPDTVPSNHSPHFAPVPEPTIEIG